MNRVTAILGTKYPIIQGAMQYVANGKLAAAVSEAGGLGVVAAGGISSEQLITEINIVRKLTQKQFAVNLNLQYKNVPELVKTVIEQGIKIITTGGAESYLNICGSIKLNSSANASWAFYGLNSQVYNFIPNLEEQRLLDGIAKAGLVSHIGNYLAVFSYDASGNVVVTTDGSVNPATGSGMTAGKRYYVVRNVPNCEGMADGVMTSVINCYVKLTCKSGVCDA